MYRDASAIVHAISQRHHSVYAAYLVNGHRIASILLQILAAILISINELFRPKKYGA